MGNGQYKDARAEKKSQFGLFIKFNTRTYFKLENQQVKLKKSLTSQTPRLKEGNETTLRDEVAGYSLNLEEEVSG